ncbi:hypothetical protein CLOM621_06398 [Clostridium sp. M62/1]|nr:hypothetical protein CLOM621_06398 [Clostridium sp. M62/1]
MRFLSFVIVVIPHLFYNRRLWISTCFNAFLAIYPGRRRRNEKFM